ncbi:MAG: hypothetical protein WD672_15435 [Woeseia sp.]
MKITLSAIKVQSQAVYPESSSKILHYLEWNRVIEEVDFLRQAFGKYVTIRLKRLYHHALRSHSPQ